MCRPINSVFVVLIVLAFFSAPTFAEGLAGCEGHVKHGPPSDESVLLCRLGYALSHDGERKVARWVSYHLTREKVEGIHTRSDDFRPDPDLEPGERSELKDYTGSGYDRGHLAPAASMRWDERAMSESFFLSNMAPQVGVGFNRGIWKVLEDRERTWTTVRGELYIITGPIYVNETIQHIGSNHVAVPTHFYKIMFDPVRVEAIAFVLPNAKNPSSKLSTFITSVDNVEEQTGLDFLPELEDSVEALVEANIAGALW